MGVIPAQRPGPDKNKIPPKIRTKKARLVPRGNGTTGVCWTNGQTRPETSVIENAKDSCPMRTRANKLV
jgi:hypothetical protein